ncbi:MAG: hypothetical protein DIZ80_09310 [endosymbiont of Galathealinum brachiosum]|uniref:Uncharacterized protein n=1 Tax=endosymbiont of Galathealinum brachiosum TaxID=2200906 RepID=A0A370DC49_9GAMM|nr:MAG: hypothetical protein DIZ80_09310 [endosymbiont of Galathealinum brachiosum]
MKIEGTNPDTGEVYQVEDDNINNEFIDWSSRLEVSDAKVKQMIDNLDISADSKSLLYAFTKATIKVGEYIIKIGRKIFDFICKIFTDHPSATFGVIFGAIAGFLIASIPVLGFVLGPIAGPILIVFGMVGGLKEDLKDKALSRKIAEINGKFEALHA